MIPALRNRTDHNPYIGNNGPSDLPQSPPNGIGPIEMLEGRYTARYGALRLSSHYQPVFSLSHCRVVGHEGLMRVHDVEGNALPPWKAFREAEAANEVHELDRLSRALHILNRGPLGEKFWLFLNVHPAVLLSGDFAQRLRTFERLLGEGGLTPDQIVIEVLEHFIDDGTRLGRALACLREMGCLIAIDDFGAGHSNFDRIWRFHPEIVKLDKSFAEHIETSASARRLLAGIVALLHETGAMVLLEGIETREQALAALEANIDFAQGYHFAHPLPLPVTQAPDMLDQLWSDYELSNLEWYRAEARLAPYRSALQQAAEAMESGAALEEACASLLALEQAQFAYLLDGQGRQAAANLAQPFQDRSASSRFLPLRDAAGARWSRRPYFREAVRHLGDIRITRPYLSATTGKMCITLSTAFRRQGETMVLCFDIACPAGGC